MTGNYQYTIAHQRITDLHHEAKQERLATQVASDTTENRRRSLLAHISRRLTTARPTTNLSV
jgi:hypothetical protein